MFSAGNAVREAGAIYKSHQPELTLRYQILETHYPEIPDYMECQRKTLSTHITKNSMLI